MARRTPPALRGRRSRWATSHRSPTPEDAATLSRVWRDHQPGFREAVLADVRVTAELRGEHHRFRSRADALVQLVRLSWVSDSFFAQVCYRAKVACLSRGIPVLPAVLHRVAIVVGQVNIGDQVVVRPGLYLPHGQVVIDGVTYVGERVVIRPFVTVGLSDGDIMGPHIGARVRVGTGAKVFGRVRIGPRARIGANAVVLRDVPADQVAVGVPARSRPATPGG